MVPGYYVFIACLFLVPLPNPALPCSLSPVSSLSLYLVFSPLSIPPISSHLFISSLSLASLISSPHSFHAPISFSLPSPFSLWLSLYPLASCLFSPIAIVFPCFPFTQEPSIARSATMLRIWHDACHSSLVAMLLPFMAGNTSVYFALRPMNVYHLDCLVEIVWVEKFRFLTVLGFLALFYFF